MVPSRLLRTNTLWVHFPAWASKTLLRRHSVPSSHREGAWGLCEQSKTRAGALLAFCVNQGISASFSPLYFLISRLRTTRFWSIKGPQHSFYWMSKIQSKLPGWLLKLLFFVWLYLEGLLYDQRAVFVFLIYNFIALISENVICTVSTFGIHILFLYGQCRIDFLY